MIIKSLKSIKVLFLIVIISQLALLIFYMKQKVCFFCDEIYSYSLSNSRVQNLFQPIGLNHKSFVDINYKWFDGNFFKDYISVSEKYRFDYSNAYINQTLDSHPPLYNYLLHTICSFFPNTFSKWYGFAINLCCFPIIQLLLFCISKKIFNSKKHALLTCFIYGFSAIAIDCHIYIRMYSLSTLFFILLLYLYLICLENKCSLFHLSCIVLTIILGSLTHYHFFVYAFFLTLSLVVLLLKDKDYKKTCYISFSVISGVILSLIHYPYLFIHLKTSPRGTEVFELFDRISPIFKTYANIWKEFIGLNSTLATYLSLFIFSLVFLITIVSFIKKNYKEINHIALNITIINCFIFCLFISLSVNYKFLGFINAGRFFFPISFIIPIIIVALLYKFKKLSLLVTLLIILSNMYMLDNYYPYTDNNYSPILNFEKIIKGNNLIILSDYNEAIQCVCPQISNADKVYIIPKDYEENILPKLPSNNKSCYLLSIGWNNEQKIPFKKIISGILWDKNTNYDVYDMSIIQKENKL